jgi:hypothetical protein
MRRADLALVLGLTALQAIVVTGPFLATGQPPGTLSLLRAGVVVPFLLLLGTWLVARATVRSRTAMLYALVVVAFSPVLDRAVRARGRIAARGMRPRARRGEARARAAPARTSRHRHEPARR